MKFTVAVSRDISRCVFRNVRFSLRRSSKAYMLQRNTKNFVIRKYMFYINIGPVTIITNSEIIMKLRFISDQKNYLQGKTELQCDI
jgi:hypothetical protein